MHDLQHEPAFSANATALVAGMQQPTIAGVAQPATTPSVAVPQYNTAAVVPTSPAVSTPTAVVPAPGAALPTPATNPATALPAVISTQSAVPNATAQASGTAVVSSTPTVTVQ